MSDRSRNTKTDLVTGATGFIGRYLAARLLAEGRSVRIICRKGSEAKVPRLSAHLEIVHVDLARLDRETEIKALNEATQGVSRVFHCAGHVSDWGTEEQFRSLNVEATRSLLEACSRAGSNTSRFIHLSSIAAFGTPSPSRFDDTSPLGNGKDFYSKTKAEAEKLVFEFSKKNGLPVTVIRPAVVYGFEGTWLEEPLAMIEKGKMFLLGGGRGTCHPCYVENLVDAILLAADHPRAVGNAYIVADDDPITFREYFDSIASIAKKGPIRKSIPLPAARALAAGFELGARITHSSKRPLLTHTALDMVTTRSTLSMKKIREELGFSPRYSFRSAIAELRAKYDTRQFLKKD